MAINKYYWEIFCGKKVDSNECKVSGHEDITTSLIYGLTILTELPTREESAPLCPVLSLFSYLLQPTFNHSAALGT
ncbi:hypothetical protein PM082_023309 [Marasmius tenuissimus]|nr:hypothetical protein PM082_023309 [Marasmius tenuissimus]